MDIVIVLGQRLFNVCYQDRGTRVQGRVQPADTSRWPAAQRPIPAVRGWMAAVRYSTATQSNRLNCGSRPGAAIPRSRWER